MSDTPVGIRVTADAAQAKAELQSLGATIDRVRANAALGMPTGFSQGEVQRMIAEYAQLQSRIEGVAQATTALGEASRRSIIEANVAIKELARNAEEGFSFFGLRGNTFQTTTDAIRNMGAATQEWGQAARLTGAQVAEMFGGKVLGASQPQVNFGEISKGVMEAVVANNAKITAEIQRAAGAAAVAWKTSFGSSAAEAAKAFGGASVTAAVVENNARTMAKIRADVAAAAGAAAVSWRSSFGSTAAEAATAFSGVGKVYSRAALEATGAWKEAHQAISDGAEGASFNIGQFFRHSIAIVDGLLRGQRGAVAASFNALVRDSHLGEMAVSGLTAAWVPFAAVGVGALTAVGYHIEQAYQRMASLRETAASMALQGFGSSEEKRADIAATFDRNKAATNEYAGAQRDLEAQLNKLPAAAQPVRQQFEDTAKALAGIEHTDPAKAIEGFVKAAQGGGEALADFIVKTRGLEGVTDASGRSLKELAQSATTGEEAFRRLAPYLIASDIKKYGIEARIVQGDLITLAIAASGTGAEFIPLGQGMKTYAETAARAIDPLEGVTIATTRLSEAVIEQNTAMILGNTSLTKREELMNALAAAQRGVGTVNWENPDPPDQRRRENAAANLEAQAHNSPLQPAEDMLHQQNMEHIREQANARKADLTAQAEAAEAEEKEIRRIVEIRANAAKEAGGTTDVAKFIDADVQVQKAHEKSVEARRRLSEDLVNFEIQGLRAIVAGERSGAQDRIKAQQQIIDIIRKGREEGLKGLTDLGAELTKLQALLRQEEPTFIQKLNEDIEKAKLNAAQMILGITPKLGAAGASLGAGAATGLDTTFAAGLDRAIAKAHAAGIEVSKGSGFRSHEEQQRLYDASDKSGHMVARPGHSQHEMGRAVDLRGAGGRRLTQAEMDRLKPYLAEENIVQPMPWEPWHVEPAGARTAGGAGAVGARMPGDVPIATRIRTEEQKAALREIEKTLADEVKMQNTSEQQKTQLRTQAQGIRIALATEEATAGETAANNQRNVAMDAARRQTQEAESGTAARIAAAQHEVAEAQRLYGETSPQFITAQHNLTMAQKEQTQARVKDAIAETQEKIQTARQYVSEFRLIMGELVADRAITAKQAAGFVIEQTAREIQIEKEAVSEALALDNLTLAQKRQLEKEQVAVVANGAREMAAARRTYAQAQRAEDQKYAQDFKTAFDRVGSTLEQEFGQLLSKQTTWAKAFQSIWQSATSAVTSMLGSIASKLANKALGGEPGKGIGDWLGDKASDWIFGKATKAVGDTASSAVGGAASSAVGGAAASAIGGAATGAAEAAALTGSAAALTGSGAALTASSVGLDASAAALTSSAAALAASAATSGAGSAAGGILGKVLGTVVGGLTGGPAGAAVGAISGARGMIVPSAAGGMNVGASDGGQLAILHPREMVLPAHLSAAVQAMAANGGTGKSPALNLSMGEGATFLDGPSFQRWFTDGGGRSWLRGQISGLVRSNSLTYRTV